ncbi:DNA-binding protein [Solibacillus sp.]|uniref:DNA-binding protein n=1 Tax=Solibacillus sp. TaxID=1909654 RepID=UPI0033158B0F
MLNVQFDPEAFRTIIREEIKAATEKKPVTIKELPAMLTRDGLKEFLHIGDTKAAELLSRADFPVLREAGVLIPTHLLMRWIEDNTQWIQKNAKPFKVG